MDIHSSAAYPTCAISNFAPYRFVFDDVQCASMEGLLQSFKYEDPHTQSLLCMLVGREAKRIGAERNVAWKRVQRLWWKGIPYERIGSGYQGLLDRAYAALAQNEDFRRALLATGRAQLSHSIGSSEPRDTVLTEYEFCSILTALRVKLRTET